MGILFREKEIGYLKKLLHGFENGHLMAICCQGKGGLETTDASSDYNDI